jgi:hypothetical protein
MTFDLWGVITRFVTMPGLQAIVLIFTAMGTVGSVITALVIATRSSRRQDTRDQIEERAALEDRAQRQAVLVIVRGTGPASGAFSGGQNVYSIQVDNNSERPIYDLAVWGRYTIDGTPDIGYGSSPIPLIAPANSADRDVLTRAPSITVSYSDATAHFRDAFGDVWELESNGTLTLLVARPVRSRGTRISPPTSL